MGSGRGPTLAERAASAGVGGDAEVDGDGTARHCWVLDPQYPHKLPGLLLRWERVSVGWSALVVYAVPDRDATVQRWVLQRDLGPA